jgi:hypothetical protein
MTPALASIVMLLRMGSGLLVWASAFVVLYAGHSLACQWLAPAPDSHLWNPVTALLIALALAHAVALVALGVLWWRYPPPAAKDEPTRTHRFRYQVEGLLLLMSFTGLTWLALPLVMTPPCVG